MRDLVKFRKQGKNKYITYFSPSGTRMRTQLAYYGFSIYLFFAKTKMAENG